MTLTEVLLSVCPAFECSFQALTFQPEINYSMSLEKISARLCSSGPKTGLMPHSAVQWSVVCTGDWDRELEGWCPDSCSLTSEMPSEFLGAPLAGCADAHLSGLS